MPRALVIDLWGSATLRTGGEEIAQGLALMGCRPIWDRATGRVTGIEVLPPRRDRPPARRRDLAHLRPVPRPVPGADRADRRGVRAVAGARRDRRRKPARGRSARRRRRRSLARIFGTAPGAYGAGVEDLLGQDSRPRRTSAPPISPPPRTPMAAPTARARALPGAFAARVAAADLLLHASDDPGRDLLEGAEDVAFVGGFAAAAAALGRNADLIMLDTTDPQPAARAAARRRRWPAIVRARADQSALHRRPDAPRPARRRRACRDRRPPGRFRRDHRRGAERADRSRARRLSRPTRACATSCCAKTPPPRAPSPSGSMRRAGAGLWHPRRNDIDDEPRGLMRAEAAHERARTVVRRGACPGLSAPMQTGDGLLARLIAGRIDDPARCVRRPLRRRRAARQRHHRDHRARQPAGPRADARRRRRCSPRRSTRSASTRRDGVPVLDRSAARRSRRDLIDPQALAAALRRRIAERRAARWRRKSRW